MSDAEEFMSLAAADSSQHTAPTAAEPTATIASDSDDDAGSLTQWTRMLDGFAPTTSTLSKLPPGLYQIISTNRGDYFSECEFVTDNLLRLPDSKSDQVIKEIEDFWTKRSIFKKLGFTHKRGFLLFGPPGSGKTSTIAVVTKDLIKAGGLVIMGNIRPSILATNLADLREIEPDRPIVVLFEDIDTLIQRYGEAEILSLLDGEASIDHVVYLATTNYPENLDGRVVNRPSRFDKVVKIGMPNAEARAMYLRSRGIERDITPFVELTNGFSIAHLKELIVSVCCFGNDLEEEAERIRNMAKTPKSDEEKPRTGF
jgi:hypothetical protein